MKKAILLLSVFLSLTAWAEEGTIRLKTGEMPLLEYVTMTSKALGLVLNATAIDNKDSSHVTVSRPGPFTREEVMTQMLTTTFLQGYTLVHDEELDFYRVMRQRDARDAPLRLVTDLAQLKDNDEIVSFIFKPKYFPVEGLARFLRSFAPANSRLIPEESTNSLIITDSARSIVKYQAMISRLDTPKAAEEAKAELKARAKNEQCPAVPDSGASPALFVALFALIGLIIGFLARGYAIRRIEGGL
jgi:type II secretory pathway component GspD/PulD (secretin)